MPHDRVLLAPLSPGLKVETWLGSCIANLSLVGGELQTSVMQIPHINWGITLVNG